MVLILVSLVNNILESDMSSLNSTGLSLDVMIRLFLRLFLH